MCNVDFDHLGLWLLFIVVFYVLCSWLNLICEFYCWFDLLLLFMFISGFIIDVCCLFMVKCLLLDLLLIVSIGVFIVDFIIAFYCCVVSLFLLLIFIVYCIVIDPVCLTSSIEIIAREQKKNQWTVFWGQKIQNIGQWKKTKSRRINQENICSGAENPEHRKNRRNQL